MTLTAQLSHRASLRITGADAVAFLQGLLSNDVARPVCHAALLTPQGKFLHDAFVLREGDEFLLDCEADRADDMIKKLTAYKLRSKVAIDRAGFDIWAVWDGAIDAPRVYDDPRLPELGQRAFVPTGEALANITPAPFEAYDRLRVTLGVPDGSRDMEIGQSTLAEGNFDFLNGIDWKKGCYVGQELTARMHYRGLAKKRLFPVRLEGPAPMRGDTLYKDGEEAGEMRSHAGNCGLALLKIEAVLAARAQKEPLTHEKTRLWPEIPLWMKIDAAPQNL